MRVFVTGATGFVMGAVARALRARGDAVTALVRSPSRAASLTAVGCLVIAGDVTDPASAVDELRRCDALVHGAAIYEIGVSAQRTREMEETNVTGTRRMLDAARAAGTARIVYVSTIAAFGNTHGAVVAEGHRPTSPPTSAYEDTKRRAHEIALDAARSGAPIVIVQPGHSEHARSRFVSRRSHLLGHRCESARPIRHATARSTDRDAGYVRGAGRKGRTCALVDPLGSCTSAWKTLQ